MSNAVTWIGHSTVLVEIDGVRLLTDPALRGRMAHLKRVGPFDNAEVLRGGVDAVLVSHLHHDHLDLPSLKRLGRSVPVVVPRGAGRLLRKRRFERVVEAEAGEEIRAAGPIVRATHAEHAGGRGPFGTTKAPALGFLVCGSLRVYFAGDTDLFEGMAALAPLDLALVPIWGWGPSAGAGHLDPRRAAESLRLLRPRLAVPIHWGTYYPLGPRRSLPAFLTEPVEDFRRYAEELAPSVEVRVLPLGGRLELGA